MRAVRAALGANASAKLSVITGASISACDKWLQESREPSGGHLVSILRSEVGREAMRAVLEGSEQKWVRDWRRQDEIIRLKKSQEENRRRIEALEIGSDL